MYCPDCEGNFSQIREGRDNGSYLSPGLPVSTSTSSFGYFPGPQLLLDISQRCVTNEIEKAYSDVSLSRLFKLLGFQHFLDLKCNSMVNKSSSG